MADLDGPRYADPVTLALPATREFLAAAQGGGADLPNRAHILEVLDLVIGLEPMRRNTARHLRLVHTN